MARLMVGVSGIRGVYGDGLSESIAERFAHAFGLLYPGTIVIGRDSRKSGRVIADSVISGLSHAGNTVIDLGFAATPTVEMAVTTRNASGGVIITASHNPSEWNGLKFLNADGVFLNAAEGKKLVEEYESIGDMTHGRPRSALTETWDGADEAHIQAVLDLEIINTGLISTRGYTVCLDAVNGAGGKICIDLLKRLGCTVHAINTEPTGDFPHGAEPVPDNIGDLCSLVRKHRADVGFAVDPDVDRLSLVSEKGKAIGEEYTLALAADYVMGKTGKPAACNLSTSRMIDDAAARHNTVVYRSAVGEINVVDVMRKHGAEIGGEGNGGVILPALHYGRDAVLGIALILQLMVERNESIGALAASFPVYCIIKEKMDISGQKNWIANVKTAFAGENMDFRDGVKIIYPSSWVHVRASNTEPIIRLMAEAPTEREARSLLDKVYTAISGGKSET
ncbi:MAG: phosphoglucosamine mutase [Candidatus Latescibacteria bacterium]|nr:phosphoglucosamine mutase [Candidatus Latescibacterota bacterium]